MDRFWGNVSFYSYKHFYNDNSEELLRMGTRRSVLV